MVHMYSRASITQPPASMNACAVAQQNIYTLLCYFDLQHKFEYVVEFIMWVSSGSSVLPNIPKNTY